MQVIKDLFSSKKFIVFLAAAIVLAASKLGIDLNEDSVNKFLGLAVAYILGQGIADNGKEAAKVASKNGITTSPGVTGLAKVSILFMITLIAGIMLSGCGPLTQDVKSFGNQVYDQCAKPQLQGAIAQAVPTIETAAISGWKAGLDAAVKQGEADLKDAGWCAVKVAMEDLQSHLGGSGAEGNESVGISNLQSYAAEHNVTFK